MLVKPSPGFSNIMLRQKVYDSNIYSNRPLRIQNPSPDADWKIRRISLFFQLTKLFSVQSRQAKNAKKHIVCISWLQSWQLFQPSSMAMYSFEYCQGHFKGHFKIRRNVFESFFSSLFSDKLSICIKIYPAVTMQHPTPRSQSTLTRRAI